MKTNYSFLIGGTLWLASVCANAQFPVTDPSLPVTDFAAQFQGSYGNGGYFQAQSQYGLFNFSYAAITPPPAPFYNQITAQAGIYGYTGTTPPQIWVSGNIVASSLSAVSLTATTLLLYEFTIAGTAGAPVSVNVSGSILGNATQVTPPPYFTEAAASSFYVANSPQNLNAAGALSYLSGSTQNSPNGFASSTPSNPTLSLIAGDMYYIEMKAEIDLNGTFSPGLTVYGNAGVDPEFTLTPQEIADGYQLEFSPGIVTPAPEPSAWTFLTAGVGMIFGCLGRRSPLRG